MTLQKRGDLEQAEAAYRRADERGSPEGARNLGIGLFRRGDLDGAEAAYRRSDERGLADGSAFLGALLNKRGDRAAAEDALQRADKGGSADGAYLLGCAFEDRGDIDGAEAAYRRAIDRGNSKPREGWRQCSVAAVGSSRPGLTNPLAHVPDAAGPRPQSLLQRPSSRRGRLGPPTPLAPSTGGWSGAVALRRADPCDESVSAQGLNLVGAGRLGAPGV